MDKKLVEHLVDTVREWARAVSGPSLDAQVRRFRIRCLNSQDTIAMIINVTGRGRWADVSLMYGSQTRLPP